MKELQFKRDVPWNNKKIVKDITLDYINEAKGFRLIKFDEGPARK